VSSATLEERRCTGIEERRQSSLFEDLERGAPGRLHSGAGAGRVPATRPNAARDELHPRSGGDRLTLEARLERTWEGLLAVGAAECPVCRSRLEWRAMAGVCRGCRSTMT